MSYDAHERIWDWETDLALERPPLSQALRTGSSSLRMHSHPQGPEPGQRGGDSSRSQGHMKRSGGDPVGDGSRGVVRCAPLQPPGHSNNPLERTGGREALRGSGMLADPRGGSAPAAQWER